MKANQTRFHDETENFFKQALLFKPHESRCDYYKNEEYSRGRREEREVWSIGDLAWLPQKSAWKGLKSLVCVRSRRRQNSTTRIEIRYYISSLPSKASKLPYGIRSHWGVENKLYPNREKSWEFDEEAPQMFCPERLPIARRQGRSEEEKSVAKPTLSKPKVSSCIHWLLDVSYPEDGCKVCKDHGAENVSVIRRATLNILKGDKKTKAGIKNIRSKAVWDRSYMLELLGVK